VGPPLDRPDPDPRSYFLTWLERDGPPFWSFWENLRTWWAIRHLPNVMLLHYNDLKRDLPGQIRRIASFLDIGIDEDATDIEWLTLHHAFCFISSTMGDFQKYLNEQAESGAFEDFEG